MQRTTFLYLFYFFLANNLRLISISFLIFIIGTTLNYWINIGCVIFGQWIQTVQLKSEFHCVLYEDEVEDYLGIKNHFLWERKRQKGERRALLHTNETDLKTWWFTTVSSYSVISKGVQQYPASYCAPPIGSSL